MSPDSSPSRERTVDHPPAVLFDEDCETGFLVNAEDMNHDRALATFMWLCQNEYGTVKRRGGGAINGELLPYRPPREDDPVDDEEAILIPCPPDEATERVWTFRDVEVDW